MKTYQYNKDDVLTGFEIDNVYVSPRFIAKYLSTKDGVSNIRRKKLENSDHRLEFDFRGAAYVISEDYGDSSRYWIGPKDPNTPLLQTAELEAHFKDLKEPWYAKVIFYGLMLYITYETIHLIYVKFFAHFFEK